MKVCEYQMIKNVLKCVT